MPSPASKTQRGERERQRIAQEAARLLRESGIHDPAQARRKAALRLGIHDEAHWPPLAQVELALREQQRLFDRSRQPAALHQRREAALQAMQFLQAFQPRLVGAVLDGTADDNCPVLLHLHCDDTDAIQRFLHDQRIPAEARSWPMRTGAHAERRPCPGWEFSADGIAFELRALAESALRHPPLDDDGRPMPRAGISQLRQLLDSDA